MARVKKGTVISVDSNSTADMVYTLIEKYPGLKSYQIANYAGVSEPSLSKVTKAVNALDDIGSFEEIRKELRLKGCLGSVDSRSLAAFKAQDDNRKLQMELGGLCIQYGLSKRDLMKLDQVKKYGKENVLDYVIEHHMTLKSCKKVYEQSKAFDAVNWRKSM